MSAIVFILLVYFGVRFILYLQMGTLPSASSKQPPTPPPLPSEPKAQSQRPISLLLSPEPEIRQQPQHTSSRAEWFNRYGQYLKTPQWQEKRGLTLSRDGHRCQICGGIATEVHHRSYRNVAREAGSDL